MRDKRQDPWPEPRARRGYQTVRPHRDVDAGSVVVRVVLAAVLLLVGVVVDPSGTREMIRWLWEVVW